MTTNQEKITQLHKTFGHPVRTEPTVLNADEAIIRGRLMFEEFCEFLKASGVYIQADIGGVKCLVNHQNTLIVANGNEPNIAEQIDAIADMQVINYGTAVAMGIDADAAMDLAHKANMSKLAEDGTAIINGVTEGYQSHQEGYDPFAPVGKFLKGPNYMPPDFQQFVIDSMPKALPDAKSEKK